MTLPACLLLGRLQRDTIITADGKARIDQPGGNLLYAAAASKLWGQEPGPIARVGSDFPSSWIENLAERGLDVSGIRVLDEAQDLRRFIAYSDLYTAHHDHPIKHFAKWGLPLPKELLGYAGPQGRDSKKERTPLTLRQEDIPAGFHGVDAAHLCPLDYFSHSLMPAALRAAGVKQVTLEASASYMQPAFWNEIPVLVNGLSAFIADEIRLRDLFVGRGEDLADMMEAIASFNCSAVIVRTAARGNWLYQAAGRKRIHLPPYPARTYDITDTGSSFGGAFAAELARSHDLERALLVASATASLAVEGSGGFYVMEAMPGLVESRAQLLQAALRVL